MAQKIALGGRLFASALLLSACGASPSALEPQGPAAREIAGLWWWMLGLGTAVGLFVLGFIALALFRRRSGETAAHPGQAGHPGDGQGWIIGGGIIMPAVVLTGVLGLTLWSMRAIAYTAPADTLVVEVIGWQYWWEVRYPDQQVVTANEIHIPAGQPVTVRLTSVDVIHSFWVPELHGKLDMTPGLTTQLILQADQPGIYRGQCAEFCGVQHAKMALLVIAEPPEVFAAWVAAQAQPASAPADENQQAGQAVFVDGECAECHTIRGTNAAGLGGPDLTHLGSRTTLAAGTLPNTPEHLAEFVGAPQDVKPGNLMPDPELSDGDLTALLAYLGSLE